MAKMKIPKRIAGVKIPKVLRKNSLLKSLISTAAGRQIAADALVAAAGAAAAALVTSRAASGSKGSGRKSIVEASEDGVEVVQRALKDAANALTNVLGNAAQGAMGGDDDRGGGKHRRPTTH